MKMSWTNGWILLAALLVVSANAGENNADGIVPSARSVGIREISGCHRVGMLTYFPLRLLHSIGLLFFQSSFSLKFDEFQTQKFFYFNQ